RIVGAGPLAGERIEQVKGSDYALAELLGDGELVRGLGNGSQATIYLAPGDYHRVHAPFAAAIETVRAIPGTLFPVNPPARRRLPPRLAANGRRVCGWRVGDGRAAGVVMVGGCNGGDATVTAAAGRAVQPGDELGRFGFGSTVVALVGPGGLGFPAVAPA